MASNILDNFLNTGNLRPSSQINTTQPAERPQLEKPALITLDHIDCTTAFLHNLSKSFKNDTFSDVTLQVGKNSYPAHKSILAASSPYFERMFFGGYWKERDEQRVVLEETEDCQKVFPDFLRYFYTGSVTVSRQTVIPLVTLADKYTVDVLKNHCSGFMSKAVNDVDIAGALTWLTFAEQMNMDALSQRCYEIICWNFEKASSLPAWSAVSYSQLLTILQRSDVVVPSEYSVYEGVQSWLQANQPAVEKLDEILSHVDFTIMTTDELLKVEQSSLASESSSEDQINAHVLRAFRHIALTKDTNNVNPIKNQRICTSDEAFRKAQFSADCSGIVLACGQGNLTCNPESVFQGRAFRLSQEPDPFHHHQWLLVRSPHESGEFAITMRYNRMVRRQQHRQGEIPEVAWVRAQLVFQNTDGTVSNVLNYSAAETIPRQDGGVLIEIPGSSFENNGAFSGEVLYSVQVSKT